MKGGKITIEGSEARHIVTVLRKRVGDEIDLFDGRGNEFRGRILEIDGSSTPPQVKVVVIGQKRGKKEPKLKIILFQSIPKGNKFDFIVQKSTEIGVSEIVPITTERTIVRLDCKGMEGKVIRWQRIAREAAKQSRRSVVPKIGAILDFPRALDQFSERRYQVGIIPWEMEEKSHLGEVLRKSGVSTPSPSQLAIFIGPEGGFTVEEVGMARGRGVIPVTLGSRILRTETAGLAVAIIALYESEDLG